MISSYIDVTKCCGCENCAIVCPTNAIEMKPDKEGFLQPYIENRKCVNCGKCENNCPLLNDVSFNNEIYEEYYGYIDNEDQCCKSASGGMAQALYKYIIERQGIIYGVEYTKNFESTVYKRVDTKNYQKLLGTKYSQARKGNIFKLVLKDLCEEKLVLFVGVPCEIAALKIFLGKEYEKLITVQLVCMGVTSSKLLESLKNEIIKNNTEIVNIEERYTYKNWSVPFICLKTENDKVLIPFDTSYYAYGYNSFGRLSCYDCKFKGENRVGDITIGDFWSAEKYLKHINKKGMSIVSIHTFKGKRVLEQCGFNIFRMELPYDWNNCNPFVCMSRTNKKKRKEFSYNYINNDYNLKKACNITMSFSEKLKWNLGRTIPNSVWTELYKIKSFLDKYIM